MENDLAPIGPDVDRYLSLVMQGMTRGEAALKAGYSESMSRNPKQIETTIAFKEALDAWIPETKIVQTLANGLEATESMLTKDGNEVVVADYATRHKYMETYYKLKNKIKGGSDSGNTYIDKAIIVKWGDIPKEQQDAVIEVRNAEV